MDKVAMVLDKIKWNKYGIIYISTMTFLVGHAMGARSSQERNLNTANRYYFEGYKDGSKAMIQTISNEFSLTKADEYHISNQVS